MSAACFSLSDFRLARSRRLTLGVGGSPIYSRWRAGSCPSFRPRRRRFLFAVMGWWPALLVCAIDGGAGGELPGHRDRRPRDRSAVRVAGLRRALSPTFSGWRDGVLYPLAGGSRRIRRGACWLRRRDAARPARAAGRCWPHDGAVAGGAVADSFLVIFRFGATMALGRSERTTMRPLWSYGVDGADSPDRKPR